MDIGPIANNMFLQSFTEARSGSGLVCMVLKASCQACFGNGTLSICVLSNSSWVQAIPCALNPVLYGARVQNETISLADGLANMNHIRKS